MENGDECISPERTREFGLIEHRGNAFIKNAISPFSNSILLRCGWCGVFSHDSRRLHPGVHFLTHVLPPFVITQSLNRIAFLLFSKCFDLLECSKGIRFLVLQVSASLTG